MAISRRLRLALIAPVAAMALSGGRASMQGDIADPAKENLPTPTQTVLKNWGALPDGRVWGSTAGVDIGPDGHIWAYDRCAANTCDGSNLAPIFKFDRSSGKVLASFGAGMFVFPHGLHVDRDGNVWVTDALANKERTKGHQVFKFSPHGKLLLTLGKAGVAGNGPDTFNEPCDVITAPNGDIFVSDGHSGQYDNPPPNTNGRIVKFTKDGQYVKEWGKLGSAPGEFRTPHALAFDSRGRLFVADRGNHRIQIFDQDGKLLDTWYQFGRVSGLFIDRNDTFYAIDSESNATRHPNWKTGVRIGNVKQDKVVAFIPPHPTDKPEGAAGEGVAVDREGNVYAAEGPNSRPVSGGGLTKYVKRSGQTSFGYDDTPMQPGGRWHIHDGKRPQPRIVTPVSGSDSPRMPAPDDALVLVGSGNDLSAWQTMDGSPAAWTMRNGVLETGKGLLRTKADFTDFQLHVEFATPTEVKGDGQDRGNSGVFLLGKFEVQVLDSYRNQTYPDGQAAAMYGQHPPLVNASRPPGEWQSYDIVFTAPRFTRQGKLEKPAVATVLHNGVVVHNAMAFWGPTAHKRIDPYTPETAKGPIALQDHGNPVRYRNVWIRPLRGYDET